MAISITDTYYPDTGVGTVFNGKLRTTLGWRALKTPTSETLVFGGHVTPAHASIPLAQTLNCFPACMLPSSDKGQ